MGGGVDCSRPIIWTVEIGLGSTFQMFGILYV